MTTEAAVEAPTAIETTDKASEGTRLIRYYSAWSFGAGVVPVPVVDMVLVMGVQVQMLRKLAALYGVTFADDKVKNILAVLLGGLVPEAISVGAVGQALRAIPGIGPLFGLLTMPTFSAAATYAVGRVFRQHFESGGTFLTFKPEKVREHFRAEFEAAKADPTLNPAKNFANA